jgi:hypothetical protein
MRPTSALSLTAGMGVTRAIFGSAIFKDGYGNSSVMVAALPDLRGRDMPRSRQEA